MIFAVPVHASGRADFAAAPSSGQTATINQLGGCSYQIFTNGTTIYAQNCHSGSIDYSGTVASTVISNAISALSNGGIVFIKAGLYTIATQIDFRSNIVIAGEGPATELQMAAGFSYDCSDNLCSLLNGYKVNNVTVRDLTLDGNWANNPLAPQQMLIGFQYSSRIQILSNTLQNSEYYCVYMWQGLDNLVDGNICRYFGGDGIHVGGNYYDYNAQSGSKIVNNVVEYGSDLGIVVGTNDVLVSGNTVHDMNLIATSPSTSGNTHACINSQSETNMTDLSITDNTLYNCLGYGIYNSPYFGYAINTLIEGNTIYNSGQGIYFSYSDFTTAENNTIDTIKGMGVYAGSTSAHWKLTNNTFRNIANYGLDLQGQTAQIVGNTFSHILYQSVTLFGATCTDYLIQGNIFDYQDNYVISVSSGSQVQIKGNNIKGNSSGYGIDIGSSAASYVLVQGNTIRSSSVGVNIRSGASYVTVVDNDLTGLATPISDSGSHTVIENNTGYNPQTLTTNVLSGSGSVTPNCPGGCSEAVASPIFVTATPASGSSFSSWSISGASCSGLSSTNPCAFTMPNNPVTVSATFTQTTVNSTTTSVSSSTMTTLSSTTNSTVSSTTSSVTSSTSNVSAQMFTAVGSGQGSVTPNCPNGCSETVGSQVTVTANPSSGWLFTGWSTQNGQSCSSNPCTFNMPNNQVTLKATFTQITQTLTANVASGSGTVTPNCPSGCSETVASSISITATAASGWSFSSWSISGASCSGLSSTNPCAFTMPNNTVTVSAAFTQVTQTLITGVDAGSGSISSNCPSGCGEAVGSSITVQANPSSGWQFSNWSTQSGISCSSNPCTFNMPNQQVTLKATFTQNPPSTQTLTTPVASGQGTVNPNCPAPSGCQETVGQTITVTGTASSGWQFSSWIITGASCSAGPSSNPCQFTMPNNALTLAATFTQVTQTLTTNVASGSGSVSPNCPGPNGCSMALNSSISVQATPASGWQFSTWNVTGATCSGEASSNPCTFSMPNNPASVSATFTDPQTLITSVDAGSGSVLPNCPSGCQQQVGRSVSVSATANSGWAFSSWTVTGASCSGGASSNPCTFTMPSNAVTLSATFTQIIVSSTTTSVSSSSITTLSSTTNSTVSSTTSSVSSSTTQVSAEIFAAVDSGQGSVTPNCPSGCSEAVDSSITVTATPSSGWQFSSWSSQIGISCSSNPCTFSMPNNAVTLRAMFTQLFDFRLANSGTSSNLGGIAVQHGSSGTISISVTLISGAPQTVSLSCAEANGNQLPTGVSCSFNPASNSPDFSSTLTVSTNSSTPIGYYTIRVIGTGGGLARVTIFTLCVT